MLSCFMFMVMLKKITLCQWQVNMQGMHKETPCYVILMLLNSLYGAFDDIFDILKKITLCQWQVNMQGMHKETPLHDAARNGHFQVCAHAD